MHIQKVLNSSVVLVQDDSGARNPSCWARASAMAVRRASPLNGSPSDRVFLPLSNPDAQPMLELFSSIPASYLELTQDIVDDAEQSLGVKLSAHIYLLLTDHLHFAVERQQKGSCGDQPHLLGNQAFLSQGVRGGPARPAEGKGKAWH